MFLVGMATFTFGSALCAVAPSVGALVAARVLQAAGGAMIMPSTLGLILPAFPAEKRAVAVGIWSAVGGVAAALGPPIGGVLVEADWRWIFIVNVPVGIAAIVAGRAFLPEIRESVRAPRPDGVGALLLAASIALLTAAIVEGPDWGWADPRVIGGVRRRRARARRCSCAGRPAIRAPVIELPLLRVRSVAVANGARDGLLRRVRGDAARRRPVPDRGLGLLDRPRRARDRAGAAPGGAHRHSRRPPRGADGTAAAGDRGRARLRGRLRVAAELVGLEPAYASAWLPGFLLGGIGVGLVLPSLPTAATAPLPPDRFATGTALFAMSRQIE